MMKFHAFLIYVVIQDIGVTGLLWNLWLLQHTWPILGIHVSAETVEKVLFLHFSKFAYNNIKHLEVYKLPFSGFSTVSLWKCKYQSFKIVVISFFNKGKSFFGGKPYWIFDIHFNQLIKFRVGNLALMDPMDFRVRIGSPSSPKTPIPVLSGAR